MAHLNNKLCSVHSVPGHQPASHVFLDNHLGHVKSQSCPLMRSLCGKVWVKYPVDNIVGNPAGIVPDNNHSVTIRLVNANRNPWAFNLPFKQHVLCIEHNIEQGL